MFLSQGGNVPGDFVMGDSVPNPVRRIYFNMTFHEQPEILSLIDSDIDQSMLNII